MTLKEACKKLRHRTCTTDGKGYWTSEVRNVRIQSAKCYTEKNVFAPGGQEEFLCVVFDPKTWDIDKHGLIYTDKGWLYDLRTVLRSLGYEKWDKINYTEQGMQGETYVHLIVGQW